MPCLQIAQFVFTAEARPCRARATPKKIRPPIDGDSVRVDLARYHRRCGTQRRVDDDRKMRGATDADPSTSPKSHF